MAYKSEPTPSGRWRGCFKHPATKKLTRKTFDYQYEADAWAVTAERQALADLNAALAAGNAPGHADPAKRLGVATNAPTLWQYGQNYLAMRSGELTQATRNKYASHLRTLARPVGEVGDLTSKRMDLISKSDIRCWIRDARATGVGVPTVNDCLILVGQMYREALEGDEVLVPSNPTKGIDQLPRETEGDYILSHAESSALLATIGELRIPAMIGLHTGLRWQEIYGLRPMALQGDFLHVSHVVDRAERRLRGFTKGKRPRDVPMTAQLVAELSRLAEGKGRDDLLFPAPDGGVMDYNNWRSRVWGPTLHSIGHAERIQYPTNQIRKYGPKKGEPYLKTRYDVRYGVHALRHTYGSRLAASGRVSRSEIAELMGHADERTTARYIHTGENAARLKTVRDIFGQAAA